MTTPALTFDRIAGSHSLAAAGQSGRSPSRRRAGGVDEIGGERRAEIADDLAQKGVQLVFIDRNRRGHESLLRSFG